MDHLLEILIWISQSFVSLGDLIKWLVDTGIRLMEAGAWPALIFGVVLIFRPEIGRFIDRMKKANVGAASVEADAAISAQVQADQAVPVEPTPKPGDYAVLLKEFQTVSGHLLFEKIHNVIFQDQINFLTRLSVSAQPTLVASDYYQAFLKRFPGADKLTFPEWLQYITQTTGFAEQKPEGFSITPRGREFLAYINSNNYVKPF